MSLSTETLLCLSELLLLSQLQGLLGRELGGSFSVPSQELPVCVVYIELTVLSFHHRLSCSDSPL